MAEKVNIQKHPARKLALFAVILCAVFCLFSLLYIYTQNSFSAICISCAAALAAGILSLVFAKNAPYLATSSALSAAVLILFALFSLNPAEKLADKDGLFILRADARASVQYGSGTVDCTMLSCNGKETSNIKVKLILLDASPSGYQAGDKITVYGSSYMTTASSRYAQGSFLNLVQTGDISRSALGADSILSKLRRFSCAVSDKIMSVLPGDTGALLSALLCGDQSHFGDSFYSSLKRSGLAHIAAVSGMHVSIITALLCVLLGKKAGVGASLLLLPLFAAFTGFSPSVMRAVIMGSLSSGAFLFRKEYDPLTAIFSAAAIIASFNPFILFSPSFLLSFFSTLGIILLSPHLTYRLQRKLPGKLPMRSMFASAAASVAVSVSATVFTLPLQLIFFASVSLVSVVSNLFAVWAVPIAMFAGIILLPLCVIVPYVQGILVFIMSLPLRYLVFVIKLMGNTLSLTARSNNIFLITAAIGLVLCAMLFHFKKLSGKACTLLCLLLAILCFICSAVFPAEELYIYGENGVSAMVFQSGGKSYAINAPVSYNGRYFCENTLSGITPHTLIITDPAYAASGNAEALAPKKIYAPAERDCETLVYSQSGSLKLGKVSAQLIHTGTAAAVILQTDRYSLLDVTALSPYDKLPELLRCDALVINSAFGSAPAVLRALCAQTKPSVVFVSGSANMEQLKEICACTVMQLDKLGAVRIY